MDSTVEGATAAPRTVATLLGHAQVEMAILCLGSLLRHSAQPLRLQVHDDGTLSPEDRDRLALALGEPRTISRAEAEDRLAGELARRPATRAFRRANPLGLKLVDTVLLAASEELAFCDSDILFLRPFSHLYRFPAPSAGAVFMSDSQNAYSVRSWHLLRHRRLRLPCQVNSGIVHFRTAAYDPDRVEWFLGRQELGFAPVWTEQTCWAWLGQSAGCWLLDPAQVRFPRPEAGPDEEAVALHFVSPLRGLLQRYDAPERSQHAGRGLPAGPPVVLDRRPARRCGAVRLLATEVRRRWRRI